MTYDFEKINKVVEITPIGKIFSQITLKKFRKDMKDVIQPNRCFYNAMVACAWFKKRGLDVKCVDGYLNPNEYAEVICAKYGIALNSTKHPRLNEGNMAHRFLVYNGKYFCPTLEFLFGMEWVRGYDYTALRIFTLETLIDYADMLNEKFSTDKYPVSTVDGRTFLDTDEGDITLDWGHIDDDGNYVEPEIDPIVIWKKYAVS